MGLKVLHGNILKCYGDSSDNNNVSSVKSIENHLLEISLRHRMSRCSKAVSELFSAMEIINHGKIAFAWFEDPDEFASVYPKSVTHIGS